MLHDIPPRIYVACSLIEPSSPITLRSPLLPRRSHKVAAPFPPAPAGELPAQRTHAQIVPDVMASTGASGMEIIEFVADEKFITPPPRPPLAASHVAPVTVATTPEPASSTSEPPAGAVSKLSQKTGDGTLGADEYVGVGVSKRDEENDGRDGELDGDVVAAV